MLILFSFIQSYEDGGSYSRFQNSKSISSDDYFGRETKGTAQICAY